MSRWFRLYSELLNDPKVQRLDGEMFKGWINLLCIASANDGVLPSITDIAFALRVDENAAITLVERLLNGGLIDRLNGGPDGSRYAPHGWKQRQYKSDTSTDRVKRFRERSKTVTVTPPEADTDTDTDKNTLPKGSDGEPSPGKVMWSEALSYYGDKKRSLIGKWIKIYTAESFIDVMADCQRNDPLDRIAWTEGALKKRKGGGDDLEFTGFC